MIKKKEVLLIKKKWHLFFNTIFLIPVGILIYYYILDSSILIPMIYLAIPIGAVFPDLDLAFGQRYHRHWLFHSILWLIVCWVLALMYPIFMLFIALLMYSVGIHLLCDMRFRKVGGTYTIKLFEVPITRKVKGLNYGKSTLWLFLNFLLSIILLIITILVII